MKSKEEKPSSKEASIVQVNELAKRVNLFRTELDERLVKLEMGYNSMLLSEVNKGRLSIDSIVPDLKVKVNLFKNEIEKVSINIAERGYDHALSQLKLLISQNILLLIECDNMFISLKDILDNVEKKIKAVEI